MWLPVTGYVFYLLTAFSACPLLDFFVALGRLSLSVLTRAQDWLSHSSKAETGGGLSVEDPAEEPEEASPSLVAVHSGRL